MHGNDFDTPSQALNYRKLELLEPDWLPSSWPQRLAIGAVWMAHKLLDFFAPDDPITVRQKRDRSGKPMYYVRDRLTGNVQTFDSEAELRIWLEERY
ncbi:MAG TPA: hypothetical protein VLS96_20720 [Nodosilinea sp.]|nr:hypothetical protein [Nodosilinea sp.]